MLTPEKIEQVKEWVTANCTQYNLDGGLEEYIPAVLQSALESGNGTQEEVQMQMEVELADFLDSHTTEFVGKLLSVVFDTSDQPSSISSQSIPDASASDSLHTQSSTSTSESQQLTQPQEADDSSAMADEEARAAAAAGGSKRKRRDEEGDEENAAAEEEESRADKRLRNERGGVTTTSRSKKPCFDFQKGSCRRGASCHYEHITKQQQQQQQMQQMMQQQQQMNPMSFPSMPSSFPTGAGGQANMLNFQQQWQMQQQMMQMMQQQYAAQMAAQQAQQNKQRGASNDDSTEISLTGSGSSRGQFSVRGGRGGHAPSGGGGPSHAGLGFHKGANANRTNGAIGGAAPKFVSASSQDMSSTLQPSEEKAADASATSGDLPAYEDTINEEEIGRGDNGDEAEDAAETYDRSSIGMSHAGGSAIPFTYSNMPTIRGGRGGGRGGRGGRIGPHGMNAGNASNNKLFLTNVPKESCNLTTLSGHFDAFGSVTSIKILGDTRALVEMSSHAEAQAAMNSEKAVLGNRFITVQWAKGTPSDAFLTTKPFHKKGTPPQAADAAPKEPRLSAVEVANALKATNAGSAAPSSSSSAPATTAPPAAKSKQEQLLDLKRKFLAKQQQAVEDTETRLAGNALSDVDRAATQTKLETMKAEIEKGRKEIETLSNVVSASAAAAAPAKKLSATEIASSIAASSTRPAPAAVAIAAAPASAAPKLSALEVVAKMKAQKEAAAAAAAAAASAGSAQ